MGTNQRHRIDHSNLLVVYGGGAVLLIATLPKHLGALMNNKQDEISALLVERAGYVHRNLAKRVASVDAALAALGHKATQSSKVETTTIEPTVERASQPAATKRKK